MTISPLIILASYLWGAIPSAYLVARFTKGIDIREYGSGNVGASNLSEQLGKWVGFALGAFDCLVKGALPVTIVRLLDQDLSIQVGVGLAVITGHCWSAFIGFTGGRGVATGIGVIIGFVMWKEFLTGAIILGGFHRLFSRDTGLWTLGSMLALPILTYVFGQPEELIVMSVAIALVLITKRLTANWERPVGQYNLLQVLAFRLLWDRDVPHKTDWTRRQPTPLDVGEELDD